jgi:hypothetical protein
LKKNPALAGFSWKSAILSALLARFLIWLLSALLATLTRLLTWLLRLLAGLLVWLLIALLLATLARLLILLARLVTMLLVRIIHFRYSKGVIALQPLRALLPSNGDVQLKTMRIVSRDKTTGLCKIAHDARLAPRAIN